MAHSKEKSAAVARPEENSVPKKIKKDNNFCDKVCSILSEIKQMKIELVMFMYMFANFMTIVSQTTLIMDKVCLVHLGESQDVCSNLKNHNDTKSTVSKLANNYSVATNLLQMLPSSLIACFIGAWSDKYSRKIPLIVALIGSTINGLISSILAAIFYSRVEFLFISSFISGASGGMVTVMTVLYSYASDITTFDKRTIKYAFMQFAFGMAMPLGQLSGGWLFQWFGYIPVFLAATCCRVFALFFVICVLRETKGLDNKDSWRVKFRNFWSFQPVIKSFKATIKSRPNNGRLQILLLITAMSLAVLSYVSTGNINYIYCHHMYDWGNTKFSTVSAIFSVIGTVAVLISVPIFRHYKKGDPTLGIIGSCSLMAKNVALGFSETEHLYFLGSSLGLLTGLATLAGRSRISKIVSKDDIGKVFSFLSTAESLVPIISTAVASQIFNATLDIFPGFIYVLLGGLLIIPLVIFIWVSRLPKIDLEEASNEKAGKAPKDSSKTNESTPSSSTEDGNFVEMKTRL